MFQLLKILVALNEAGITHRDFKSSNIMIDGDILSGDFQTYIIDFGLIDAPLRNIFYEFDTTIWYESFDFLRRKFGWDPRQQPDSSGMRQWQRDLQTDGFFAAPNSHRPSHLEDIWSAGIVFAMLIGSDPRLNNKI